MGLTPLSSTFNTPAVSPSPSVLDLDQGNTTSLLHVPNASTNVAITPDAIQSKLVAKIRSKVLNLISSLDVHIQAAQLAFKMCNEGMVLADWDVRGLESRAASVRGGEGEVKDAGATGGAGSNLDVPVGGEGWDVSLGVGDSPTAVKSSIMIEVEFFDGDGDSRLAGVRLMQKYAKEGEELAKETERVFKEVSQEVYKIAAQTKDNTHIVLLPPGAGQAPSLRKPLKEVALDLVANLSLFSAFSQQANETSAWWTWVNEDLERNPGSQLCPEPVKDKFSAAYAWWETMKGAWQAYYDIISALHAQYPELSSSARTWEGTAVIRAGQLSAENSVDAEGFVSLSREISPSAPKSKRRPKETDVKGFLMWSGVLLRRKGSRINVIDTSQEQGKEKKAKRLRTFWRRRRGLEVSKD
ncbi:hypothetical protein FA15DRAFT_758870 [Coprinopsis marcescibilis]|uniref:Uncharacterized protein n=1 Tax=Coprinopsis marcescibilis TaxID=230819 RepID=A0A5C3KMG0_COPMA|nr:hypothetical protein FA15DRAFT_758870 [Coprinopsis marcescibilis]